MINTAIIPPIGSYWFPDEEHVRLCYRDHIAMFEQHGISNMVTLRHENDGYIPTFRPLVENSDIVSPEFICQWFPHISQDSLDLGQYLDLHVDVYCFNNKVRTAHFNYALVPIEDRKLTLVKVEALGQFRPMTSKCEDRAEADDPTLDFYDDFYRHVVEYNHHNDRFMMVPIDDWTVELMKVVN